MDANQIKKIISKKIFGKVTARHTEDGHFYELPSGDIVASVTTKIILEKSHLTPWAIKVGIEWLEEKGQGRLERLMSGDRDAMLRGAQQAYKDIRDTAGDIGTHAHDACENYIKQWIETGEKPGQIKDFISPNCIGADGKTDHRVIAACRSVQFSFDSNDVVPIASELLVGSAKLKSAGTLDFLCYWNGRLTLVDFKTSNQIDPIGYSMQIASYKEMFEEMSGVNIEDCKIILMSKKDDRVSLHTVENVDTALTAFRNMSMLYDWVKSHDVKIIKDVKSKELIW